VARTTARDLRGSPRPSACSPSSLGRYPHAPVSLDQRNATLHQGVRQVSNMLLLPTRDWGLELRHHEHSHDGTHPMPLLSLGRMSCAGAETTGYPELKGGSA
jgi:hypothetical protein